MQASKQAGKQASRQASSSRLFQAARRCSSRRVASAGQNRRDELLEMLMTRGSSPGGGGLSGLVAARPTHRQLMASSSTEGGLVS